MNSDIIVVQPHTIQNDVKNHSICLHTICVFGRKIEKLLNDSIRMMWLSQNQKPSYKTINRFRVNPKVDALLESLFIQFHSQCLKQHLIDDRAILLMVRKLRRMPIDIHLYGKRVFKAMRQNE